MKELFTIFIGALLVNNVILGQFLGICSFLGVSQKTETAKGMGAAVTFVMLLATLITFVVNKLILIPFHMEYLSTLAFILVIAALVQFVETVIKKIQPGLYRSLGIFLPLITTNCAVLGVAVTNIDKGYGLAQSLSNTIGSALGYVLAIVILAGLRERMEDNTDMPAAFRGLPISLITAGLMAIAFYGFSGLV
ncbi:MULTISPECIES: electron transport complex protein RnfA [Clostridium]|uniref:Ion-translocating oxidoreductase complex subunit A n=2 Tax=Clostridium TaxID=1485 RepID=A0A927W935_9CLOT|nr:electron transport complex protein RnfA [Clostridium sulfidigenes]HBA05234.1 electron transport complex subunit RsxA [Clostridium sp.]HCO73984.1 electron transport complex subunit RsxA [Clostridium sp.]